MVFLFTSWLFLFGQKHVISKNSIKTNHWQKFIHLGGDQSKTLVNLLQKKIMNQNIQHHINQRLAILEVSEQKSGWKY